VPILRLLVAVALCVGMVPPGLPAPSTYANNRGMPATCSVPYCCMPGTALAVHAILTMLLSMVSSCNLYLAGVYGLGLALCAHWPSAASCGAKQVPGFVGACPGMLGGWVGQTWDGPGSRLAR
jgi:hypothetical protein